MDLKQESKQFADHLTSLIKSKKQEILKIGELHANGTITSPKEVMELCKPKHELINKAGEIASYLLQYVELSNHNNYFTDDNVSLKIIEAKNFLTTVIP